MNKSILFLEASESLYQRYRKEFEQKGYTVKTTPDRDEAIERIKNESIDIVIVDLVGSERAEMEYLQRIMNVDREVKVVLNSDSPTPEWDFRSWIADAVLVQSQGTTVLRDTIESVLQS